MLFSCPVWVAILLVSGCATPSNTVTRAGTVYQCVTTEADLDVSAVGGGAISMAGVAAFDEGEVIPASRTGNRVVFSSAQMSAREGGMRATGATSGEIDLMTGRYQQSIELVLAGESGAGSGQGTILGQCQV